MKTARIEMWGKHYNVQIELHEYANHGLAVELKDCKDGATFTKLSCWLPPTPALPRFHFFLKDWSENEGIAPQLVEQGLIELTHLPPCRSGFVIAKVYKIVLTTVDKKLEEA